jgi:hypothetical protein
MILTVKSSNDTTKYLIKFKYSEIPFEKDTMDEYGRSVHIEWSEHDTLCEINEIATKNVRPIVNACVYKGWAHCSYKDSYNKITGRNMAINRALDLMQSYNAIDSSYVAVIMAYFTHDKKKSESANNEFTVYITDSKLK